MVERPIYTRPQLAAFLQGYWSIEGAPDITQVKVERGELERSLQGPESSELLTLLGAEIHLFGTMDKSVLIQGLVYVEGRYPKMGQIFGPGRARTGWSGKIETEAEVFKVEKSMEDSEKVIKEAKTKSNTINIYTHVSLQLANAA